MSQNLMLSKMGSFTFNSSHSAKIQAFLGRDAPTPLISEILAQVDDTIVEAVRTNGTGGGHVDWTHHPCALIVWLGSHGGALPAQQVVDTWAPGHGLTVMCCSVLCPVPRQYLGRKEGFVLTTLANT